MSSDILSLVPSAGVDHHHKFAAHVKIVDRTKALIKTDRKKVAIVGFSQSTFRLAPFENPDYEIWGMNQLYRHIPRADRWFDIHHNWNEFVVDGTDHLGWLHSAPIPIYMKEPVAEIPNSVGYPLTEICGLHPQAGKHVFHAPDEVQLGYVSEPNGVLAPVDKKGKGLQRKAQVAFPDYFTSSIAFMLALAIYEGFTTIDLYGIDLTVGEEYDYQKPCAEFWIGFAMGKGIEVGIPAACALLKTKWRYGWESEPDWPLKLSEVKARLAALHADHDKHAMELEQIKGAIQATTYFMQVLESRLRNNQVIITKA